MIKWEILVIITCGTRLHGEINYDCSNDFSRFSVHGAFLLVEVLHEVEAE